MPVAPPAAPTRPRRLPPTRRTPLSQRSQLEDQTNQLADDLGASLRISKRSPAELANNTVSKRVTSHSKAALKPSNTRAAVKPVAKIASEVKVEGNFTPAERAKEAMTVVNTSLQALSALNKSGWKASASSPTSASTSSSSRPASTVQRRTSSPSTSSAINISSNLDRAGKETAFCSGALAELRSLIRDRLIGYRATDVEKAAGSLIANLVDMELFHLALPQLASMRASIVTWYLPSSPLVPKIGNSSKAGPTSLVRFVEVAAVPLPASSFFAPPILDEAAGIAKSRALPEDIVPLVLAVQQYTLACLFRADLSLDEQRQRAQGLARAFQTGFGSPLEWRQLLEPDLPNPTLQNAGREALIRRVDAMMTSMFGTITKGCIGADALSHPSVFLTLRTSALMLYATTHALSSGQDKLDSFLDQARKVLLLHGRQLELKQASETEINDGTKASFERLHDALQHRGIALSGKAWTGLCEVVLHIAKRADDLLTVERMSALLGTSCGADESPEAQVAPLCAKAIASMTVLEVFFNSKEDKGVSDHIRRLKSALPIFTRLRLAKIAANSHTKIDKILERLRYVVVKHIKGPYRLDQLMKSAGEQHMEASDVDKLLLSLLEGIVAHVESVTVTAKNADSGSKTGRRLSESTVEVLLVLAYSLLVIGDRHSYETSYNLFLRAAKLLAPDCAGDKVIVIDPSSSVRSLASALYNVAGTLYNESKPESAIKFIKLSCELTDAGVRQDGLDVLSQALDHLSIKDSKQDDSVDAAAAKSEVQHDLANHLSKRFELLALCQQAIGEKQLAHDAFVAALLASVRLCSDVLECDASTSPVADWIQRHATLVKLVQRATKLATFDLLRCGSETSLNNVLASAGVSSAATAAVLEIQLNTLNQSLDRNETHAVIPIILEDLLRIYDPSTHPMRRARTLVRLMQQQCSPTAARGLAAAATAAEIESLCATMPVMGLDRALASYAQQYLAFSHVWLAFHAQLSGITAPSETIFAESRQALAILRASLDADMPASPSVPLKSPAKSPRVKAKGAVPKQAPATATRKRIIRSAATDTTAANFKTPKTGRTLAGSRRIATVNITPPPSASKAMATVEMVTAFVGSGPNKTLRLDDIESCYRVLDTLAGLLGALGDPFLKIAYLKFLRRLTNRLDSSHSGSAFVATSASLAHEYLRLGKTARAGLVFSQAGSRVQSMTSKGETVAPHAQVIFSALHAEYFALLGNQERSAEVYVAASSVADAIEADDPATSTTTRILDRTAMLQRGALAAGVCSSMLQRRGELARSLGPALQSMRLWTRAVANASRLNLSDRASTTAADHTTFDSARTNPNAPLPDHPASQRKFAVTAVGPNAALSWLLAEHLGASIMRVAELYSLRGTAKSAEHYAQAVVDFSRDIGSRRLTSRALALRASVRLHSANADGAELDLDLINDTLDVPFCAEAVSASLVRANLLLKSDQPVEALEVCDQAQQMLDSYTCEAADDEPIEVPPHYLVSKQVSPVVHRTASKHASPLHLAHSPCRSQIAASSDSLLPSLQALLVRTKIQALRQREKFEQTHSLLHRLGALTISEEDRAEQCSLLASMQLSDLLKRFTSDPVLGLLPESVLSIPTLTTPVTSSSRTSSPRSTNALVTRLREIDNNINRAVSLSVSRTAPHKMRELALLASVLRALQDSIGKPSKRSAAGVAHVLDLSVAVTLKRDMLDAIDYKLADNARHDDLVWPRLDCSGSSKAAEQPMSAHWATLRERYKLESAEPTLTEPALSTVLPEAWTCVSMHLSPEHDCLILVRQRRNVDPLVFRVPLDRLARREGEEESYAYDIALEELQDIVANSNLGAQSAKHVEGKEARTAWWAERKELDTRLKTMLETIENEWFGVFKSVLHDARDLPTDAMTTFKARIERTLRRMMVRAAQDKKGGRLKLDESILECLAALPPTSRDEDFEDLYYFMIESFQFSGVPVACDETDVDQMVVDLRAAYEELYNARKQANASPDEHLFLVLDKTLQGFPWESMPSLRGRSVSRLPSLSFLRDRLELMSASSAHDSHAFVANPSSTGFILNPGGDLTNTQKTFEPWLTDMTTRADWSGIVARVPSDLEMSAALSKKEVILYFGHGGAEQYVRSQTIRNLPRCAVTMLWGCSSGMLKDQGDYDPIGTPNHYMIAGCPALVANLWDVTDKDIDKFADHTFRLSGLSRMSRGEHAGDGTQGSRPGVGELEEGERPLITLTAAVAQSRDVPLLKYLNGAAPVVYGIPVRFRA